ncbi:Double zinc ribbon [Halomicrobium zhouii]|uniref:Double zinc ribbon n=1 Tax=Halomicrobium zhouii TaxID=767519 RepID=A0A1I6LHM2_9EURY|nr:zinc ribbon domain-containing protein [Halomicrobium zhouii]SFS02798.1 Double zinc ribbon [Halomicrobium zhouii]
MSESDTASVECPLCGEAFDPAAAGGWCTNSDCGEWQYEADATSDEQSVGADDSTADGEDPLADVADGSEPTDPPSWMQEDDDESADADESDGTDDAAPDEAAGAVDDDAAPDEAAGAVDDDGADDDVADDAETEADLEADDAVSTSDADDGAADADSFDCPGCGTELAADVNFCPDCGSDVSSFPADDGADDELAACPSCGGDVDADDSFCAQCGEDLDAHRGGANVLTECPDCGTDVGPDDSFCADCGTDLDAARSGGAAGAGDASGDSAPSALALTAHGKTVVAGDGDIVGREIRSLLTEAGRPEDEAVRVHREHVRFVREDGQFYAVALGQNPTRVNGTSLTKGDREAVAPGDELELSEVVTLDVEAA